MVGNGEDVGENVLVGARVLGDRVTGAIVGTVGAAVTGEADGEGDGASVLGDVVMGESVGAFVVMLSSTNGRLFPICVEFRPLSSLSPYPN